jgi:hypothetical protein
VHTVKPLWVLCDECHIHCPDGSLKPGGLALHQAALAAVSIAKRLHGRRLRGATFTNCAEKRDKHVYTQREAGQTPSFRVGPCGRRPTDRPGCFRPCFDVGGTARSAAANQVEWGLSFKAPPHAQILPGRVRFIRADSKDRREAPAPKPTPTGALVGVLPSDWQKPS